MNHRTEERGRTRGGDGAAGAWPHGRRAGAILVLLTLLTGVEGCRRPPEPGATASGATNRAAGGEGPIQLNARDVVGVQTERTLAGIRVVGSLNPAVRVDIKARMSEELEAVLVDRGTVVTQGQVLARLDDRGPKAELTRVKSRLAAAERDLRAAEILYKGGAIAERSYSNAKVAMDSAESDLTEADQALDHTVVRSPIAGVISDRAVSSGETVSPGQVLFTVVNSEHLECVVSVMPADAAGLRRDQRAVLRVAAYDGRELEGRVDRIDPLADPETRRVRAYLRIPNLDGQVVAGLFCTGTILTNTEATDATSLFIPRTAVRVESGTNVVYAVREGRLERRRVVVADEENARGWVEVHSGLEAGDTVLLATQGALEDGLRVEISKRGETR